MTQEHPIDKKVLRFGKVVKMTSTSFYLLVEAFLSLSSFRPITTPPLRLPISQYLPQNEENVNLVLPFRYYSILQL